MDGQTVMERDAFYRMLLRTMPRPGAAPFAMLPWSPRVHLAIFVHRVSWVGARPLPAGARPG